MINIDINKLNKTEVIIHETLKENIKDGDELRITAAASLCDCSVSKISKFIRKLGFKSYKQYISFLAGKELIIDEASSEVERIENFLKTFDFNLADDVVKMINNHEKIIVFGYGPSYICAHYFQHKLQVVTSKTVFCMMDEVSLLNLIDDKSLIIIFSTTGQYRSFENIYNKSKEKQADFLFVLEEYNNSIMNSFENVILLTNSAQSSTLAPYEKSRAVFFIFIEIIMEKFLQKKTD